jgi:sn-glycerol 3-phosphate transport system ATP-binding protein
MADISIRAVRKSFGKTEIVHGVDLDIRHGEFIVILGPSGCGKSTLLRLIAGLEGITAGEIAIEGTVVNRLEPRERGCAMVFQNYALYPHMTVAGNIGYALKVAGVSKPERAEHVGRVAKTLGLEEFLDRKPSALSGGQRQRVAMGRAMIREPRVFLFDEPLSNLDAKLRVQMRLEIRRLHQRLKTTSVFVTHDQLEAMTLADRLVVMNEGRIEQTGSPVEVYRRPASLFVAGFIGSPPMNFLEARALAPDLVSLASGHTLRSPPDVALPPAGTPITIGFRPEDVRIAGTSAEDALEFEIELAEELGAGLLLHGMLAGIQAVVALPSGTSHRGKARIPVHIPPEALHIFDAASGLRLQSLEQRLAAE